MSPGTIGAFIPLLIILAIFVIIVVIGHLMPFFVFIRIRNEIIQTNALLKEVIRLLKKPGPELVA